MAKSRYTHSCGHDGVATGHNRSSADYLARKYSAGPCWECAKAAESAAAAQAAQASGLPALTGTPKQIAYAEVVRAERIAVIDAMIAEIVEHIGKIASNPDSGRGSDALAEITDAIALIRSEWLSRTDARAWLDEKGHPETVYDRAGLLRLIRARGLAPTLATWVAERAAAKAPVGREA